MRWSSTVRAGAPAAAVLAADRPAETMSVHEQIELPEVRPVVTHHRRLAVRCPACGTRVVAPVPDGGKWHAVRAARAAVATYLKTFQALSYERLQAVADLFGLISARVA